jgi:hypothetical protein
MSRQVQSRLAKQLGIQRSLDELSAEDPDSMADALVAAALSGNIWAVQEIARAIDD